MQEENSVLDMAGTIYAAASAPERWRDAVSTLVSQFAGRHGSLVSIDRGTSQLALFAASNGAFYTAADGPASPFKIDRRMLAGLERPAWSGFIQNSGQNGGGINANGLSDLFTGAGGGHFLGLVVQNDARTFSALYIIRPETAPGYDEDEQQKVERFAPHFDRALGLAARLRQAEDSSASARAALNRLAAGVMVVDGTGQVALANGWAEKILADDDGLSSGTAGLQAASADEAKALAAAIVTAARAPGSKIADRGTAMALTRPSLRPPLELLVAPLKDKGSGAKGPGQAIVFISDPVRQPQMIAVALRRLYGLSKAEAELAAGLVAGKTLAQFSLETERNIETARKTLKRIFAKTDTGRQAELVRRLLTGPAAFLNGM